MNMFIIAESIDASSLWNEWPCSSKVCHRWTIEIGSYGTIIENHTITSEIIDMDISCIDFCKCSSHRDDIRNRKISVDIFSSSINDCGYFCWTRDDSCWECFGFYSIDNLLLATRSIHITGWVTTSSISKCCFPIEYLESFFHRENSITIVIVRILTIIEISSDINLDSIKCIHYVSERCKINHHIVMNRLSSNFRNFVCKEWDTLFLTESNRVECIDFSGTSACSIAHIEISRYRYHCDVIAFFIEWGKHDRISEFSCLVSGSSDSDDENIGDSFFWSYYRSCGIKNNWSKNISISSSSNFYISNSLNDIVDSKEATEQYQNDCNDFASSFFSFL